MPKRQPVRVFSVPVKKKIKETTPPPPPLPPPTAIVEDPISTRSVADWKWDDPLPPDGNLYEDEEKLIPNRKYDEGPYDDEYYREVMKRKMVLFADLWYQFVQLVAGLSGQGTSAQQFWTASETGGRAVETILDNLNLSKTGMDSLQDRSMKEAIQKERKNIFTVDERAKDVAQVRSAFTGDDAKKYANAIMLSSQLKSLVDSKSFVLSPEVVSALKTNSTATTISQDDRKLFNSISNIEEYQARRNKEIIAQIEKKTEERKKNPNRVDYDAAIEVIQNSAKKERRILAEEVATWNKVKVAMDNAKKLGQPSGPNDDIMVSEPTARLTDGTYLDDINNPDLMLLKLMFRPNKSISDSELKAWDRLYYGGTYENGKKQGDKANSAKDLKERLDLAVKIDKILKNTDAGVGWRESVLNSGMLFTSDVFNSATNMAYEKIRKVCKKEWVAPVELAIHDQTRVYFAKLVSFEIADSYYRFPGRYASAKGGDKLDTERQFLLSVFKTLERDPDGFLYFSSAHSPLDNLRRLASERYNEDYVQRNGRFHSDRYRLTDPSLPLPRTKTTIGIGKKPTYGALEAKRKAEHLQALEEML